MARDPEHWCRPELLRARAQVRLILGGQAAIEAAEGDLNDALEMSLAQDARAGALRAATDLVLLGRTPRDRGAREDRLRRVLRTFDEGYSTADHRRAVAILGAGPSYAPA